MSNKHCILFRKDRSTEPELAVAKKYFDVMESRVGLSNKTIIARYSALPFYAELERDLALQGSKLLNSHWEHLYIANFDYYEDLKDIVIGKKADGSDLHITPRSWFNLRDIPDSGSFVVKGRTNSRKQEWKSKMFAEDKKAAINIALDLQLDPLIGEQGVVIREYIPLEAKEIGINGQPFANEWRFFFYKKTMLSYGYYWSSADELPSNSELPQAAKDIAQKAADILSDKVNFFVVDVAKTQSGDWIVIEVNDGQMSGLSENDPETLYANLSKAISSQD